jgi:hypothetical protein
MGYLVWRLGRLLMMLEAQLEERRKGERQSLAIVNGYYCGVARLEHMAEQHSRVPGPLRQGPVLIGFTAVLALVASVGTVFALGGDTGHLVWALFSGGLASGGIVGTYVLGRRAGQPHSHAIAGSGLIFGVCLLIAIVAELLHASGELSNFMIGAGLGGTVLATLVIIGLIAVADRATAA